MAATPFLSTAKSFLLSHSSPRLVKGAADGQYRRRSSGRRIVGCRAAAAAEDEHEPALLLTKRGLLAVTTSSALGLVANGASGAILEADDDVELLEKVKNDRKKRLERQSVMSSSDKEAEYLQDVVYKLSKVGQAIDNNDLNTATSVLGKNTNTDWLQKVNTAFNKLSATPEEKTEVQTFNSSLASLISSVLKSDIESSKTAFVASASAFEKWTTLTGLYGQLKGL